MVRQVSSSSHGCSCSDKQSSHERECTEFNVKLQLYLWVLQSADTGGINKLGSYSECAQCPRPWSSRPPQTIQDTSCCVRPERRAGFSAGRLQDEMGVVCFFFFFFALLRPCWQLVWGFSRGFLAAVPGAGALMELFVRWWKIPTCP